MDDSKSGERLEKIFENVNSWLKFMELKNIALMTLSATILTLVCKPEFSEVMLVYKIMIGVCIFVFSSTLLISLNSLFASLDKDDYRSLSNNAGKNLMFYGDLSKMMFCEYLSEYETRYKHVRKQIYNGFTNIEEDLINQILINSRIAVKKGRCFNRSVKIIFWGTICESMMAVGLVIYFSLFK